MAFFYQKWLHFLDEVCYFIKFVGSFYIFLIYKIQLKCVILLGEGYVEKWGKAELVCRLTVEFKDNDDVEVFDCIEAAKSSNDIERCRRYLKHECSICFFEYPMNKVYLWLLKLLKILQFANNDISQK